MAAPLMSFLRPMGPPRPSTIRHFMRFSTNARCLAIQQADDPNLVASRTAAASYPPPSMRSLSRPKESKASHRSNYPKKERHYPVRGELHSQATLPTLIPEPIEPLPSNLCAPNLSYFVTRTPSNELPIYTLRKRGGNKHMTRIKKIDGRAEVLRDELRSLLGLGEKEAIINHITGHIMLKGHHKPAIDRFLRQRKF